MVETARIWYIDSGANVTFQLFGPIFGSILLAFGKELMKKKRIHLNVHYFSGLLALATTSQFTELIGQHHGKCWGCRFARLVSNICCILYS